MRTILVVEDEPQIAALVRDYLEHAGFAVLHAGDGMAALTIARVRKPDAVILDDEDRAHESPETGRRRAMVVARRREREGERISQSCRARPFRSRWWSRTPARRPRGGRLVRCRT